MIRLATAFFIPALLLTAQASGNAELIKQAQQDLAQFNSSDWTQRMAAFYDLTTIGCPVCSHSSHPVLDGIDNAALSVHATW